MATATKRSKENGARRPQTDASPTNSRQSGHAQNRSKENGSKTSVNKYDDNNGRGSHEKSPNQDRKALYNGVRQIVMLPVDQIDPNPFQPRLSFDSDEMADLVESVRAHGVLQPVTVRTSKPSSNGEGDKNGATDRNGHNAGSPNGHSRYHLVAGERRLRACKEAGRKSIPAIIRDDLSDTAAAELALVENVQRSNLNIIEEAAGYKRLMLQFRMKEERIAKKVGKSVATIKETMKLLALPELVQKLLVNKSLTPSHGQQLLRLAPFESVCTQVAQKAAQDHLTATSLSTTLLPNAQQLKAKRLIIELGYRTEFDWRETCGNCPHKAYVQSGYSSYCLNPLEWEKKNLAARELKQQEATRVMEAARQEGQTVVDTAQLPAGSYRDLTHATLPAGCSPGCPCRGETPDPRDPTQKLPVCLDPQRFRDLVQTERQAHKEERSRRVTILWCDAKEVLRQEIEIGQWHKAVSLIAFPLLQNRTYYYTDPQQWMQRVQTVSDELGLSLPWESLFDPDAEEADVLVALQQVEPSQLLLLIVCLLLAEEAHDVIHYANPAPFLDFVLGRSDTVQPELSSEAPLAAEVAPAEEQLGEVNALEVPGASETKVHSEAPSQPLTEAHEFVSTTAE